MLICYAGILKILHIRGLQKCTNVHQKPFYSGDRTGGHKGQWQKQVEQNRKWVQPAIIKTTSAVLTSKSDTSKTQQSFQRHTWRSEPVQVQTEWEEDSQSSISFYMKDTILTKWQPSLIHPLLITYQRPLTPVLWWDFHGPFMGQGGRGERWWKGERRGGRMRGEERV